MSVDYVIEGTIMRVNRDPRFDDAAFEQTLDALVALDASHLTLDMSRVKYVSSPEIGLLVRTHKMAVAGGKTLETWLSPQIFQVIKLLDLHRALEFRVVDNTDGTSSPSVSPD